jgi:hypothetical protein
MVEEGREEEVPLNFTHPSSLPSTNHSRDPRPTYQPLSACYYICHMTTPHLSQFTKHFLCTHYGLRQNHSKQHKFLPQGVQSLARDRHSNS